MSGITLHPKHGLAPVMPQCFWCNKDKGEILLLGMQWNKVARGMGIPEDRDPPRAVCFDKEPCDECKRLMKDGIILISVDEKKSTDMSNPYRTGGWCVVTEDAVRRWFSGEGVENLTMRNDLLDKRIGFLVDEAWDAIGIPRNVAIDNREKPDA